MRQVSFTLPVCYFGNGIKNKYERNDWIGCLLLNSFDVCGSLKLLVAYGNEMVFNLMRISVIDEL